MLRSIGIPARLTVGYAEGEAEQAGLFYTIRRRDSHAWPEVYFNGIGWVEFEPTTAQPLIDLPETEVVETPVDNSIDPDNQSINKPPVDDEEFQDGDGGVGVASANNSLRDILIGFGILSGLLGISAFLYFRFRNSFKIFYNPFPVFLEEKIIERGFTSPAIISQWAHFTTLTPMEKIFSRINLTLSLLRRKVEPGATPAERLDLLVDAVPENREPANVLLHEYQTEEYSSKRGDLEQARTAQRTILRQTAKNLIRRIWQF